MTSTTDAPRRIALLGVSVDKLTCEQVLARLSGWDYERPRMLAYVNAHTLNLAARDEALRAALNGSDLVLNDGIGLSIAARMGGERFPENLNGSDFTMRLLQFAAAREWSVFLLGGEPGIADAAARRLREGVPGLAVAGVCHGFTGESDELLVQRVKDSGAALLIVAFGSPLQELWLARNLAASGARLGVGVGAFLDFSAGKVRRAPRWMNLLGIEWCFRLVQEPGRLWRRYVIGNPAFLLRAWRDRRARAPRAGGR
jgi:exopolysaccharide biosynthesis WecB/TagA/CpsF family protein